MSEQKPSLWRPLLEVLRWWIIVCAAFAVLRLFFGIRYYVEGVVIRDPRVLGNLAALLAFVWVGFVLYRNWRRRQIKDAATTPPNAP